MKLIVSIVVIILFSFGHSLNAQRYVDVEPDDSGEIGALNNAINGDAGADENTIYRLKRGGKYFLNGAIINNALPLKIEAEQGEGSLPELIPGLTIDGNADVPFRPLNDLYIKNLSVTGRVQGGGLEDQIIRVQAENIRLVVDSCRIDESSQSFIRTDTRGVKIHVTNNIISRMGTPDDIDNGRVVDDRGNFIDTLVMENNTIYNITSRVVRDGSGADSYINRLVFNQNTVFNVGQRMADFGPVIDFVFTNNIIVNPAFNGREVDPDPFNPNQPDPNADRGTSAIILDSVAQDVLDIAGVAQKADIRNNNIYYTQAVLDARPTQNPQADDDDFIVNRTTFSNTIEEFMAVNGTSESNFEEVLEFSNAPVDPTIFVAQFWNNFDGSLTLDPWDNTGAPYSFSYPAASISSMASIEGNQIGDQNWPLQVISRGALEDLIDEATALISASIAGNNIGNIPQEFADSLQNAINSAQMVVDNPGATPEQIEAMIDLLQGSINYFLSGIITSASFNENSVLIYPNPVKNSLIVSGGNIESIALYDLNGRTRIESIVNEELLIDLQELKNGLYVLELKSRNGSVLKRKIIKQ